MNRITWPVTSKLECEPVPTRDLPGRRVDSGEACVNCPWSRATFRGCITGRAICERCACVECVPLVHPAPRRVVGGDGAVGHVIGAELGVHLGEDG